ncbi:hypothetical protein RRG08_054644 [Elysia crispata]|uniref:Uncharacterized protein n=1 Tax=Elysia crispata TaxID=231223 RepID=A0AAE1B0U2_9GAST|nr:hypothetical protein RRG08_054644 [Elysia crispata]
MDVIRVLTSFQEVDSAIDNDSERTWDEKPLGLTPCFAGPAGHLVVLMQIPDDNSLSMPPSADGMYKRLH